MDRIVVPGPIEGEIEPPSSKSYAQRAIAASLLADGKSVLHGIGTCDDTTSALRVVQALGARVEQTAGDTCEIRGLGPEGRPEAGTLDIGESGLSARLFTPIASLGTKPVTITGRGTVLTRPMGAMTAALGTLGVEIRDSGGFLPITLKGPMRGGDVSIDGGVSSQFLTGLLMSLPMAESDTTIRVANLLSIPYIDMTIDVMDRFGIDVDHRDYEEFYVPGGQRYTPTEYSIEGDWSASSCLLVAGAVGGSITARNLHPVSLQADVTVIEALSRAGALIEQELGSLTVSRRDLHAFSFDATDCPDLFPALAALAANCEGTSTIVGTRRLVHKECNRAEAIRSEYGKLGIAVDISQENVMRITGGEIVGGVTVESFRDHRIAMSLAVAAVNASAPVTIRDAECVSKSYPGFWTAFDRIRNGAIV